MDLLLDRNNQRSDKSFAPDKIPNQNGFRIKIDENIFKPKNRIGF
jgi:hypothetical protein